eukprot:SAG31_NODE_92_length_26360_cov_29.601881_6_plen_184_part_00
MSCQEPQVPRLFPPSIRTVACWVDVLPLVTACRHWARRTLRVCIRAWQVQQLCRLGCRFLYTKSSISTASKHAAHDLYPKQMRLGHGSAAEGRRLRQLTIRAFCCWYHACVSVQMRNKEVTNLFERKVTRRACCIFRQWQDLTRAQLGRRSMVAHFQRKLLLRCAHACITDAEPANHPTTYCS